MTLDNMTGITEGSYTGFCKSQLITCNRVKECNGVCPFEDALKHADKMQTMNEQHIIDHDREWIIGCIKHDGFIKTDRFDKANHIILDALEKNIDAEIARLSRPTDIISRADAIEALCHNCAYYTDAQCKTDSGYWCESGAMIREAIPSADAVEVDRTSEWVAVRREEYEDLIADAVPGEWIPCGEKMPKELERVNVTWLNHNPPFYYQHIKDIPQTDTAVYYRGKWYWWDATVIDILAEYGEDCNAEQIDKDIEVVAWMPLPTPYKGGDTE